jgi:hypothetical protein
MNFKQMLERAAIKILSFKSLFAIGVLVVLTQVELTAQNADVMNKLIYSVLGAKAVQYAAEVFKK